MSIKSSIESARFPVYKSGGYQVVAVDSLLKSIIEQADVLDSDLASSRQVVASLESELVDLQQALTAERERVADLESVVAEQSESPSDSSVTEGTDDRVSELETLVASLNSALNDASVQAAEDEKHISEMEAYADEVEKNNQSLRDEVERVRLDAEEAIRVLAAQAQTAPPTPPSVSVLEPLSETPVDVDDAVIDIEPAPPAEDSVVTETTVTASTYTFPFNGADSGDSGSDSTVDYDSPNDFGAESNVFTDADVTPPLESSTTAYVPIPALEPVEPVESVEPVEMVDTPTVVVDEEVEAPKRPRLMRRSR